jgi:hypothetical protein
MSGTELDDLIMSASSSLCMREKENLEGTFRSSTTELKLNNQKTTTRPGDTREPTTVWRSKALTAISQLKSLHQRASAAELRACELQLCLDQSVLDRNTVEDECARYRVLLADVRDQRDALLLELRLKRAISPDGADSRRQDADEYGGTDRTAGKGSPPDSVPHEILSEVQDQQAQQSLHDLEKKFDALQALYEQTRLENHDLLLNQSGLEEHIVALQERIQKLQDENDFFSTLDASIPEQEVEDTAPQSLSEISRLRRQLQERESELLSLHDVLEEERSRSSALHQQVVKTVEELGELRGQAADTKMVRAELTALQQVHADTLEKLVTLELEIDRIKREKCQE